MWYYENIQKSLVEGFFSQIAHFDPSHNIYMTLKDDQVVRCFIILKHVIIEPINNLIFTYLPKNKYCSKFFNYN